MREGDKIERFCDEIIARGKLTKQLKREVNTLVCQHRVTESILKIAHNDITAFIHSEDRMKEEILSLEEDKAKLQKELGRCLNTRYGIMGTPF